MSKIIKGTCGICNETKERQKKLRPDGSGVFVIPNTSIEWGNSFELGDGTRRQCVVCPDCVALEYLLKDPNTEMSDRTCQECDAKLPKTRYFTCTTCSPERFRDSEDEFIYESMAAMTSEEEEFWEALEGVTEDEDDTSEEAVEDSDDSVSGASH